MAFTIHESTSLAGFLDSLRSSGRISDVEFMFALELASKAAAEQIRIPGAVTVCKASPSGELAAVAAVFNTAELAENIFSQLNAKELACGVALTCRTFKEYTTSSLRLRRTLFIEPDYAASITEPYYPKVKNIHYCATPGYVECLFTKIQDTMEQYPGMSNIFVMQPPPTELEVTYDCDAGHIPLGIVSRPRGITYGDVWDTIREHFKVWRATKGTSLAGMHLRIIEAHLMCRIADGDRTHDP